jgi:cytochrome c551/c552
MTASSSSRLQRETLPEEEEQEPVQTKPMTGSSSSRLQRETLPEEEEQEPVQTKPMTASSSSRLQRETLPEEEQEPVQTKPMTGSSSSRLQRETLPEEEEQEPVQTKSSQKQTAKDQDFDAGSNVENQLNSSKGGGSPLPDEVRSFMEARFGADLSQVRVHTGSEAVEMNKELNAQAFTHGKDIYFGSGRYNPGSSEGKHLLAHELTHVIQQTGSVQPKLDIGNVGTEYKQKAKQVIHGNASESLGSSQKVVQQKCADCQEEDEKLMRKENPTAEKKKQDININPPSDTDTQLLAGVIFAEADAVAKTNEEREAIASVFLNSVSHVEDLRNGKICKHLKPEQRKFIYNRDKQDFGEKVFDAIKQRSVAFSGGRWKLAMNDNKMHSKEQLDKLLPSEKKALVQAIEAAKAVKSGQNRDTEVIGFNQGGSLGSRMATVKTIGKHTFYKFKKGLECGEWKENK